MRLFEGMLRIFADRAEAAGELADHLLELGWNKPPDRPDLILGLARGGVAVAEVIAERLGIPWDALVVRKIGAPDDPELGVGAMSEDGVPLFSRGMLRLLGLTPEDLAQQVAARQAELVDRLRAYRGPPQAQRNYAKKHVCVVDDGLATGVTAEAAGAFLRRKGAGRLTLAVPVAAPETVAKLNRPGRLYDEVISLETPDAFGSVGSWYERFEPFEDQQVIQALSSRGRRVA